MKFKIRLINARLRVLQAIDRYGLLVAVVRGIRLLCIYSLHKLNRPLHQFTYNQKLAELEQIINDHDGFFDIFHIPMGWHTPLFQRFQQISLHVHKLGGLAFYGGHPLVDKKIMVYEKVADNLYVFEASNRQVVERLFDALEGKDGLRMLRIQSIDLVTTIEEIHELVARGFTVIYEYIDEITPEITGNVPEFVYKRHEQLLGDMRVFVVATSDQLLAHVRQYRSEKYILSTNGVDVEFWRQKKGIPPADLAPVLNGNIIVGYHGAIAKWIDYDLLRLIADDGRYELVLIGHEHDQTFNQSGLKRHPRVHYLDSKTYFELSSYVPYYDIAILPFQKNSITDSVSPVKIFEYMAALKPIVTTDLTECRKYRSCLIGATREGFMAQLERAQALRLDPDYVSILAQEAEQNSWITKIKDVIKMTEYNKST